MRPRAVLFDLDGTLLDTLQDLADATNAALATLCAPPHPVEAYRHLVGDGVLTLLARALPPGSRDEATVARGARAMLAAYATAWRLHTVPYPGVEDMLDGLVARGLQVAIYSNKPEDFTRLTTETLLSRWRFGAVLGARPGRPLKPDPSGAWEAARVLAVPPASVLYVGDAGTDMETARAAGMVPLGALWGFRDAAELTAAGARRLLARPADLLAHVDAAGAPDGRGEGRA